MGYIKSNEINKEKTRLSQTIAPSLPYDMYIVKIELKDGTIRTVKVFCEKGTIPDSRTELYKEYKKNYKEELKDFFFNRLLDDDGLMAKEGRDDYIYLGGNFLQNGYIASRYIMQPNGKTGQENFDANLFTLKLQVEALEQEQDPSNTSNSQDRDKGKNYAISDIHGKYGSYMEAIKKLNNKDHLYIIGDVIDRGEGGIKIIQDIIQRQSDPENNPEITFLLGNHEMQFLDVLYTIASYKNINLTYEDVWNSIVNGSSNTLKNRGVSKSDIDTMDLWLNWNDGYTTFPSFVNLDTREERQAIFKFLINSYVALPQTINNKDYLFVHAAPPQDLNMIKEMKQTGKGYKYTDLSAKETEFIVQDRTGSSYQQSKENGFLTICGHSPTKQNNYDILRNDSEGFIRIDSGCGKNGEHTKLALYCIDDDRVEYIDEKESEYPR